MYLKSTIKKGKQIIKKRKLFNSLKEKKNDWCRLNEAFTRKVNAVEWNTSKFLFLWLKLNADL